MKFFTLLSLVALLAGTGLDVLAQEKALEEGQGMTAQELYQLAMDQGSQDFRKSLEKLEEALTLATGQEQQETRGRILLSMGTLHYQLAEYPEALERYQESLAVAEKLESAELSANALNNIGVIHYVWGEHDKALEFYSRAIDLMMDQNDKDGLARGYNNVANIHQTAGRFDQALDFYEKALALHLEQGNEAMIAAMHNNIGLLQYDMEQFETSRGHFETALEIEEKTDDRPGMALSLNNLGQVQEAEGQLDEALASFRQALDLRQELEDRQGVSVCLHNIGSILMAKDHHDEAIGYLEQALALAEELQVQELIRDDLQGLSEAHAQAGNYETALAYHKRFKEAHDEIFSQEQAQQMAMAQTRFEVGLKDREIDALTREKEIERYRIQVLLVVAALSLGIVLLLLNRYLFQKRAHQEIQRANLGLKKAHADLEKASRDELAHVARVATMGELAAAFAHELNQPLAAIKVNARAGSNFLDRREPDPGETLAALEDIGADAERAQEIITRLRRMMRKGEMRLKQVEMPQVINNAASFLVSEFEKAKVELDLDLSSPVPTVKGDRIQLQQVILNLLQNALTVAADEPVARVSVVLSEKDGQKLVVQVTDTGPAVPDEVISDLFEPFFTTKESGLGMGLPICRTIVEAHGGRIWAERNPGGGLTMLLELPGS